MAFARMAAAAVLVGSALSGAAFAAMDLLSDADLVSRVSTVQSIKEPPTDRILGIHKGQRVIVDVRCGDVCPAYTVRIIRYDIQPGPACAQLGGDDAIVAVPAGIGLVQQTFCIPHVLYLRKLYVDHPYQQR